MEIEIKIPAVGESISEVTISAWLKKDGDYVEADELLCEIESEKATFELNAEQAGTLHILAADGDTVSIGDVIARINTEAKGEAQKKEIKEEAPKASSSKTEKNTTPQKTTEPETSTEEKKSSAVKEIIPEEGREIRREKLSNLRKTIAKRLVEAKNLTAMLTTFNEIDMSTCMQMRSKYKEVFKEKHGIGLGFMSLFTKAVCEALKEFPAVNAQIEENEMVYFNYCDIGVAVSTPRGLVVPVVRNAEKKNLAEIERSIADLAIRGRDGKLSIEEMSGGTFTITNGGVFGSLMSTPIINIPQAAILGMHNIVERPVAVNGQVVIRPMMYVALSYDHRIIDGKESVGFLIRIKQMIEDPYRLLLEV